MRLSPCALSIAVLATMIAMDHPARGETFLLKDGVRIYGEFESETKDDDGVRWTDIRTAWGRVRLRSKEIRRKLRRGGDRKTIYLELARFHALTGRVELSADDGDSWSRVPWNRASDTDEPLEGLPVLRAGQRLRTGEDGRAVLQVSFGTLTVFPDSELALTDARGATLSLLRGRTGGNLEELPESKRFRVETPQASMAVRGTVFVLDATADATVVAVREGSVELGTGAEVVEVASGRTAEVRDGVLAAGGAPGADREGALDAVEGELGFPAMEWAYVPGGRRVIGGKVNASWELTSPRTEVEVEPLLVGRYEVTNEQFAAFLAWSRSARRSRRYRVAPDLFVDADEEAAWQREWRRDARTPASVGWGAAESAARWLGGRLPTEIEWEVAAWGGDTTYRPWEEVADELHAAAWTLRNSGNRTFGPLDDSIGWTRDGPDAAATHQAQKRFCEEQDCRVHTVGLLRPNGFGLHDVAGNAAQWTASLPIASLADAAAPGVGTVSAGSDSRRVLRGGSFRQDVFHAQPWVRSQMHVDTRNGFRIARTLPAD